MVISEKKQGMWGDGCGEEAKLKGKGNQKGIWKSTAQ